MNGPSSKRAGYALATALIGGTFLASACGSKEQDRGRDVFNRSGDERRIVLQVGPDAYSLGDFSRYVRETVGSDETELNVTSLSHLFDLFVEERLLLRAAADKGIEISPEDKHTYLEEIEEGIFTEEERAALLAADSGPLIDRLKIEKYIQEITREVSVEDDEIRTYYDDHPAEYFLPERVQVSQILLSTESKAVEVWERAKITDENGFRDLAQSESVGPEASEGGVMGIFQKGQLPAEMEEAIFAMREGEVSPIVESSYGFHIFRLDKKFEPEQVPFEDASAGIRRKIFDLKAEAARRRHLGELKESLDWRALLENLSFPYQRME